MDRKKEKVGNKKEEKGGSSKGPSGWVMEREEEFFGDGAQGEERLGEEIPAIPALDASEVHPKGSEAEKK